jgi:hypothetical protein
VYGKSYDTFVTMKIILSGVLLFMFHSLALALALAHGATINHALKIGGAQLNVELPSSGVFVSEKREIDWITRAAKAVTNYFGAYPVKEVWISVKAQGSRNSIGGKTWAGRKIQLTLGKEVTEENLAHDWTATHEMFHLAFPDINGDLNWMGEGLATYLEPLARARTKDLVADKVWSDLIDGLPQGEPAKNDQGLDHTHTWANTYWGGALFWFVADIQIREKTRNQKSLDTAMKAILKAGGDGSAEWEQAEVFEVADKSVGFTVLKDLDEKMGLHAASVDLEALWKKLGISKKGGQILYDDQAPLAAIRKSMTQTSER